MVWKMDKKYKIALSHPIREQLANVILNLNNFELDNKSKNKIKFNKKIWNIKGNIPNFNILNKIRWFLQKIWVINLRFFKTNADISFANNGFLFTNKPYIIYIEKATAIFWYSTKNYNNLLSKFLLKNRLKDKKLKKIFFRTKTAMIWFKNTFKKDKIISEILKEKSCFVYPPTTNPEKINIERFKNINKIKVLFISSDFYLKWWKQILNSFKNIRSTNIELTIISKKNKIEENDFKIIQDNLNINFIEAKLDRLSLYKDYINKSHIFLCPTFFDSFNMTINEAISSYLPIITSDFFSIPERIIDWYNWYTFQSPIKNYNNNFVITYEPWRDWKDVNTEIEYMQKKWDLNYIEKFLEDKIQYLLENPDKIYELAKRQKDFYEKHLLINQKSIEKYFLNCI